MDPMTLSLLSQGIQNIPTGQDIGAYAGGLVSSYLAGKQQRKVGQMIENAPQYEIPAEVQQMLQGTQGAAEDIRGYAQESADIAKARTGAVEAPGSAIARENIRAAGATAAQRAIEAGGSSASTLGSVADIQRNELNALRDQAIQNQVYRAQAEQGYQQALQQQASAEASAVGIESAGLREMIRNREQQFQINQLDPYYNQLQFQIANLGYMRQMAAGAPQGF